MRWELRWGGSLIARQGQLELFRWGCLAMCGLRCGVWLSGLHNRSQMSPVGFGICGSRAVVVWGSGIVAEGCQG